MLRSLRILLIEDDLIEVMKFHRALDQLFPEPLHTVTESKNGEEAIKLLRDPKVDLPDIMFVDLNMPKMNGIEFLKMIKADPHLKSIPAIVLTTSAFQEDLQESYKVGIAGYILKPLKYEQYVKNIKATLEYWSLNEIFKA